MRLGELLDDVGSRMGLGRARDTAIVWTRWEEIVGGTIAAQAEPTSLRSGVLRIRAASPAWASELMYLRAEIRQRANELLGRPVITEVRVWTGPGRIATPPPRPAATPAPGPAARSSEEGPKDPIEALERARSAWSKRRSRGAR